MLTQDQILEEVKSGEMFGIVQCDISVPDHLKDRYKDFQPIIKHADISVDDVSKALKKAIVFGWMCTRVSTLYGVLYKFILIYYLLITLIHNDNECSSF